MMSKMRSLSLAVLKIFNIGLLQPIRIYVKDYGGAETTQVVQQPTDEFGRGAEVYFRDPTDLSGFTLRYYSEMLR